MVHLANSYIEVELDDVKKRHPKGDTIGDSPAAERELRVFGALEEMGVTVFGGACTSLGASGMLFLCYFQMFFKFGACSSILWSDRLRLGMFRGFRSLICAHVLCNYMYRWLHVHDDYYVVHLR